MGFFNRYATFEDLERILRKACKKANLEITRRESHVFIIGTDRAELGSVEIFMYKKSFDLSIHDAEGFKVLHTVSIMGTNWRRIFKEYMTRLLPNMHNQVVRPFHKVNLRFHAITSAISDPYDSDFRPLVECDFY